VVYRSRSFSIAQSAKRGREREVTFEEKFDKKHNTKMQNLLKRKMMTDVVLKDVRFRVLGAPSPTDQGTVKGRRIPVIAG
jgi:hypothetical protein